MSLMMAVGSKDFISGDPIRQTSYFDEKVDIHHIFPSNYCKQNNLSPSLWNSIANKAPLSARTNRILGGKAPSSYLERLESTHKVEREALDEHLRSHLIDPHLLRNNDFQSFIIERAGAILDQIEKVMGKKVNGKTSEETVRAFGGPLGEQRESSPQVAGPTTRL